MTDQVSSTGEVMDDDELDDPGSNTNSPDPLLGEEPKSGALSNAAIVGSKVDQQDRASTGRAAMDALRQQYSQTSGSASDAYAQQRKVLEQATQRLLGMTLGPSPQEAAYRAASVEGEPGTGRYDPGAHNAVQAQILKETREAEMNRQDLLTKYGMEIPASQIGAANSRLGQITQQMRIQQSDNNNASNAVNKTPAVHDKYYTQDPTDPTKWIDHPEQRAADVAQKGEEAANAAKLKAAIAASSVGQIAPEVVEATYRTGNTPGGFSRNPTMVKALWDQVHQRALADNNDAGATYAMQQSNKALTPALAQISKQQAMVSAFEKTATANGDLALSLSNKVDRTGVPLFNRWLQNGRTAIAGDVDAAKFQAAHNTFISEYAKIMSGSMGNQATTDAAQKHAQEMLSTAMTPEQYSGVMATLRQEMGNRMSGMETQRQGMLQQMNGGKSPSAPAAPAAAPNPQANAQNAMVQYYQALGAWKAAGQKGPAPVKPQGI